MSPARAPGGLEPSLANALERPAASYGANRAAAAGLAAAALVLGALPLVAHGVGGADDIFIRSTQAEQIAPFFYLGAKHMVTGLDHGLFLLAVIFFLYRPSRILFYVTLFSIGHSVALLASVGAGWRADPSLIDAIIGLSVAWKAFDNIGGFQSLFGTRPNDAVAISVFGLFHGMGLASRLSDMQVPTNVLLTNLVSFNLGIEAGQVIVLLLMLALIGGLRGRPSFARAAFAVNVMILVSGLVLTEVHLAGYFAQGGLR